MRVFRGKTAVVTGAGSGIGRALAHRFAAEGMNVVLADIEAAALEAAARELKAAGVPVLAVPTDVSRPEQVDALARQAVEKFNGVHLLCNNAGVTDHACATWERSLEDWQWVLGVNLWGVVHGIRAFVPLMLAGGGEGHVVNTASLAGLMSLPYGAAYLASKHAVVALSEALHFELAERGPQIGVSVVCPAWVRTRILDAGRNRPGGPGRARPEFESRLPAFRQMLEAAMRPEQVADAVFDAIRENRFYVLTHPDGREAIRQRVENILAGANPVNPMKAEAAGRE